MAPEHIRLNGYQQRFRRVGELPTATISLRLPSSMLDELEALANQRDVPYQSLLKVFLAERIANERGMRRKVLA